MSRQRIHLHVLNGEMAGITAEFPLKKKVTIGRTRVNSFQIKHDTVSQRHAFLVNKDGRWLVTDSNSSNGTFVNGVCIDPGVPTEVKNGDLLKIGPENELRLTVFDAEEGEPATVHERVKETPCVPAAGDWQEKENAPRILTLREWYEDSKTYLAELNTIRCEEAIRELVEYGEALKRKIS